MRFRTDILDFNMNAIPQILSDRANPKKNFDEKDNNNKQEINKIIDIVGISKHMCGGATDLTINCLLKCSE